jgi:hypothetical protein
MFLKIPGVTPKTPGVMETPAQNASPVATTQNGQMARLFVTRSQSGYQLPDGPNKGGKGAHHCRPFSFPSRRSLLLNSAPDVCARALFSRDRWTV